MKWKWYIKIRKVNIKYKYKTLIKIVQDLKVIWYWRWNINWYGQN